MTEQPNIQRVVAADNPELANQIINEVLSGGAPEAPQAAPAATEGLGIDRRDIMPRDGFVQLPGGYVNQEGETLTEVEVVELTGVAEEALARPMGEGKRFTTILEHSVEKVGHMDPNHEILNRMLIGDRNAVLLGVRHVTYGPVELENFTCPDCHQAVNMSVDLTKDVPVKALEGDRNFTVDLSRGRVAEVSLPDGFSQTEVLNAEGKSEAELTSMILKDCVNSVDGIPMAGLDSVRNLSARDRRTLMKALDEHDFGPQLDKVVKPCPSCGEEISLPLTIGSLF